VLGIETIFAQIILLRAMIGRQRYPC